MYTWISVAVNLGIYIPLGLLVKASVYTPSFVELMAISFVVFTTELIIVPLLTEREYRRLGMSLAPDASVMSRTAGEAA